MSELLRIESLAVGYGDFQAVFGIDLSVAEAETVSIIGANGAGKSTLLKAIVGLVEPIRGDIFFDGTVDHVAPSASSCRRRNCPGTRRTPNLPVAERRGEHRHRRRCRSTWTVEQADGSRCLSAARPAAEAQR